MDKTVLITGASSGIGLELAKRFAKDGYRLVLTARNEKKLNELAENVSKQYGIEVIVLVKDLSELDAPKQISEQLKEKGIKVDILVNNAGFGLYGPYVETDGDKELKMIDLNIRALTYLSKLFLPDMVDRNQGGILNVASTAAFQPGPLMSVYYATKSYVLSFTEALANELRGTGVTVSALCPGPTQTGFSEAADLGSSKLFDRGTMNADEVADIGYRGFMQRKTIVIPGAQNRMVANLVRFLPRKTITALVRRVQEKRT